MTLKEAAEQLLKVADQIETEASEVTQFVCKDCNHTSTLAKINASRKEAGKTAGEKVTVAEITVNDKVHCPACSGIMSYKATEASEQFYYDPTAKKKDEDADAEAKKKDEDADAEASKKKKDDDADAEAKKKKGEDDDDADDKGGDKDVKPVDYDA